jgi:hypothetical protein
VAAEPGSAARFSSSSGTLDLVGNQFSNNSSAIGTPTGFPGLARAARVISTVHILLIANRLVRIRNAGSELPLVCRACGSTFSKQVQATVCRERGISDIPYRTFGYESGCAWCKPAT